MKRLLKVLLEEYRKSNDILLFGFINHLYLKEIITRDETEKLSFFLSKEMKKDDLSFGPISQTGKEIRIKFLEKLENNY